MSTTFKRDVQAMKSRFPDYSKGMLEQCVLVSYGVNLATDIGDYFHENIVQLTTDTTKFIPYMDFKSEDAKELAKSWFLNPMKFVEGLYGEEYKREYSVLKYDGMTLEDISNEIAELIDVAYRAMGIDTAELVSDDDWEYFNKVISFVSKNGN